MEEKLNSNERMKTQHKKASKVIFTLGVVLAVILVFSMITSIILLFFPVSVVEVSGDSRYDYSEIIEATGIKKGARLFYLNENKAEKAVLSALPYLERVEITSYYPNRVKIEIKEFDEIYLLPHIDGFCYVNDNYEVLEIVNTAPVYDRFSGIYIRLESPVEGELGSIIDREDTKRASELIEYIKENGFYQYLNIVDVENKYHNSFVVGKKYKFVLGAMTDVAEKIDVSFKVCFDEGFIKENNAIIDATDKKKVVLRYVNDENISSEFDFCQK